MYCVIQKVENKKPNRCGEAKKLEVDISKWWLDNDKPNTHYGYKFTGKFERPIKAAYKISIHESYREDGKSKKKQWVLCTMGYYDLIHWCLYDYADSKINKVAEETGTSIDDIYNMVNEKLDPIIAAVTKEYEATEEYKTKVKHNKILKKYFEDKLKFEERYGENTYDYCYDVFGDLRNEEYLKELKASYKARQEYKSSYQNYDYSNYDFKNFNFGGYSIGKQSNYTEEEKEYLKVIYKASALKLHPDIKKDNGEGMKFLNKLKEEWGIE
jgi:hypothetical protein